MRIEDIFGDIDYTLDSSGWGTLNEKKEYFTGIIGHKIYFEDEKIKLHSDGRLELLPEFHWDFGSWAIDTPPMVIASALHDAICRLTNARLLPWKHRMIGDKLFRLILKSHSFKYPKWNPLRYWHNARFVFVVTYSQAIARWRDKV